MRVRIPPQARLSRQRCSTRLPQLIGASPTARLRSSAGARVATGGSKRVTMLQDDRMRVDEPPTLPPEEFSRLAEWRDSTDARRRLRAQIILLSASGLSAGEVGRELGVATPTVYKWRRRFVSRGISGLSDLPRSGQPRRLPKTKRDEIVRLAKEDTPPNGLRWSIRQAARHLGVTEHQIRQVWSEAGIRPREVRASREKA